MTNSCSHSIVPRSQKPEMILHPQRRTFIRVELGFSSTWTILFHPFQIVLCSKPASLVAAYRISTIEPSNLQLKLGHVRTQTGMPTVLVFLGNPLDRRDNSPFHHKKLYSHPAPPRHNLSTSATSPSNSCEAPLAVSPYLSFLVPHCGSYQDANLTHHASLRPLSSGTQS